MKKLTLTVGSTIWIPKEKISESAVASIKRALSYDNPKYFKNWRYGHSVDGIPRKLTCYQDDGKNLSIPKGSASILKDLLHKERVRFEFSFDEPDFHSVSCEFFGTLFDYQKDALKEMGDRRFGVLAGPAGSGKKIIALYKIYQRRIPALVIVKRKNRLFEWREAIERFLHIRGEELGLIGDGHRRVGNILTIALDRSLYKNIEEIRDKMGFVIVDQCDVANPKIFLQGVGALNPRYILGLSREYKAPGGFSGVMKAYMGPPLSIIEAKEPMFRPGGIFKTKKTGFMFNYQDNYGAMINTLSNDEDRNEIILEDILYESAESGGRVVVVSERLDHLWVLKKMLEKAYKSKTGILTSATPAKKRQEVIDLFQKNILHVLLTTLKSLISEPRISCNVLVVACPFRYGYPLMDALGKLRAHGRSIKNLPVLYDYEDGPEVLQASYKKRKKEYRRLGFKRSESTYIVH